MFKRFLALVLAGVLLSTNMVVHAEGEHEEEQTAIIEMQKEAIEFDQEGMPDERTAEWAEIYTQWLEYPVRLYANSSGGYEAELARFPSDYQALIKKLHEKHPNWVFVAVDTGLSWNDVVAGESSGTKSLITKNYSKILLSNASADYNPATGQYVARDGSSWVNASDPAIAYFVDPRNYLNEEYIFAMELQGYDASCHTLDAVESILAGTQLANKVITYTDTNGKKITLDLLTYGKAILAAGAANNISPLVLASKIKQETGAKLTNGSISGNFSYNNVSYRGYYNFYNIGASATATGSAVANGLSYAMKSGSYQRPWTSPLLAIHGGAEFLAESYIAKGQNTGYFQKFNTVSKPYYGHQYMQNLTAAMSEGKTTYNSYKSSNTLDSPFVFHIPVYKNMPAMSGNITIAQDKNTAKANYTVNMRKGPSTSYGVAASVPANGTVLISDIVFTDDNVSVGSKLLYPYWAKVTYGDVSGYICTEYLTMNTSLTVQKGYTAQLSLSKSLAGEKVYYETSDPAIATVNSSGVVTGVKEGTCTIYAITSSGQNMDMIGVKVSSSLVKPTLGNAVNTKEGISLSWNAVQGADGYYIYRKGASGSWEKIDSVLAGSTVNYIDTSANAGTTYTYTVEAYKGDELSGYNGSGVTVVRLTEPELVSVEAAKTSVKVTWNKVEGASGYQIYRKEAGGSWTKVTAVEGKDTISYTDTGLKADTTYAYTVKAYNGNSESTYSETGLSGKTEAVTYTAYKTTYKVNYRTGPGTSYTKAGSLPKDLTIQVEDGYAKDANGYTWYRFLYNAKEYYVASDYVEKVASGTTSPEEEEPPVTPPAKMYTTYKTNETVNYRIGPGTSYTKAGSLIKGTTIQVEHGYSQKANGYTWYRFLYNSKEYYVASMYLDIVSNSTTPPAVDPPVTPPAKTYATYKTNEKVNYRTGPGTSYTKAGSLAKGTTIQVEDGYSQKANGYTWYRFLYNSKEYYVASMYVDKVTSGTTTPVTPPAKTYTTYKTTETVNYRTGAGTSYTKAGSLVKGTSIQVEDGYSKSANGYTWYRFKYNSKEYYVASKYVTKVSDGSTSGGTTSTPTYTTYKTTENVNYRTGAGTSYSRVGTLWKGTSVQVENGYSTKANGYTWYRIKVSGKTYYAVANYFKK